VGKVIKPGHRASPQEHGGRALRTARAIACGILHPQAPPCSTDIYSVDFPYPASNRKDDALQIADLSGTNRIFNGLYLQTGITALLKLKSFFGDLQT
jgi:hypothetical protein